MSQPLAPRYKGVVTKLLYSATMSLDGFIAGPDGDMQWLAKHLGANTNRGDDPNDGLRMFEHEGGNEFSLRPLAASGARALWFDILRD